MPIMTTAQFQTLSHKYFSRRNGTIADIDTLLDAYHHGLTHGWPAHETELDAITRLRAVIDKFQREKEEKYLSRSFYHIRKEQSENRRRGVHALREEVYARMWELYQANRTDLTLFDPPDDGPPSRVRVLAEALDKLRVRVKGTGDKANRLRSTLHADVEEWLNNDGRDIWENAHRKYHAGQVETAAETAMRNAWMYYYKDSGEPADIIRLGTVDLRDLMDGTLTCLRYADSSGWSTTEKNALGKMRGGGDAQVGTRPCKHPPVENLPDRLRAEFAAYLEELLGNEMAEETVTAFESFREDDYYRAVVHLDYYAFRSLKNIGLHKDTVGNTLFVALHYINDGPMMGPEYIDDPAPIRPKGGNGFYPDRVYTRNAGTDRNGAPWERQGTPWAKVRDVGHTTKYVWPADLLLALQAVRKAPEDADYIQAYVQLPPNGLITFVDELVFHATPSMMLRDPLAPTDADGQRAEKRRYMSSGVSVPGVGDLGGEPPKLNVFGERTFRMRIARRLSVALDNHELLPPATSGGRGGKRRFWRVWLSIVPKHWYEELPIA